MTEAELTEQMLIVTEISLVILSVVFTIISAYIVGLYWFLRKTSLVMRSVAFGFFTFVTLVITINGYGVYRHAQGLLKALIELNNKKPLSPLGSMAIENTAQGVTLGVGIGLFALAALIYLGLFYLSFLYRWPPQK